MTERHSFNELRKRMAPARRARNVKATKRMLANVAHQQVRRRDPAGKKRVGKSPA